MPLVGPMDWIRYMAERRGVEAGYFDPGRVIVVTPIGRVYEELLKHFDPEPWERWPYEPGGRWGLHRAVIGGIDVSFTRSGVGGPEVGFLEEAVVLGARHILFIGYAGGLGDVDVGDVVVPYQGVCEDGFSQHYVPHGVPVAAPGELVELLRGIASRQGLRVHVARVWSIATPYRELECKAREYVGKWGVRAVEMEVCAVYGLAIHYGVSASALLVISDIVYPRERRLIGFHDERLEAATVRAPRVVEEYVRRMPRKYLGFGPAEPK